MFWCCCKRNKVHPEQHKLNPKPSNRLHKRADRRLKCCGWEKTDNVGFHHKN